MQAQHRRPLLAFLGVSCLAALILGQALSRPADVRDEQAAMTQAGEVRGATLLLGEQLAARPTPRIVVASYPAAAKDSLAAARIASRVPLSPGRRPERRGDVTPYGVAA